MEETAFILNHEADFLKYLKSKFTLIHSSNFFFRDFHYGIMSFLKEHKLKNTYTVAAIVAVEVGQVFEKKEIFKRIDGRTWLVNYPEFALPRVDKKVIEKSV